MIRDRRVLVPAGVLAAMAFAMALMAAIDRVSVLMHLQVAGAAVHVIVAAVYGIGGALLGASSLRDDDS